MSENDIKTEDAELLYNSIYRMVCNAIGKHAANTILGLENEKFDPRDPMGSLERLRDKLVKGFGENTARNMFKITVRSEINSASGDLLLEKLGIE